MGYAARMKKAARQAGESTLAGNPEKPAPLMATYITVKAHKAAVQAKRPLRAKYSDREYLMDSKGQLRRLQPQPVTIAKMHYGAQPPPTV